MEGLIEENVKNDGEYFFFIFLFFCLILISSFLLLSSLLCLLCTTISTTIHTISTRGVDSRNRVGFGWVSFGSVVF